MASHVSERLGSLLSMASTFGKEAAISMAQQFLMPKVLEVFAEHDHEDLRRMVLANYPLVEQELSDNVKQALRNLGSNPEFRDHYEATVIRLVTPQNILHWLKHPEEWLDDEASDEHVAELKACAAVIEDTSGGMAWLERQVIELYRYADIVPEDVVVDPADD